MFTPISYIATKVLLQRFTSLNGYSFIRYIHKAPATLPTTMQVIHQYDSKSTKLTLDKDEPLPVLSDPDECLIRIYTSAPCLGELHWEEWFPHLFSKGRERVPGTEAAGVIVKMGGAASTFEVGDEVFFRLAPGQTGSLRQYSVARIAQMAHKPKNVSWVEAGATPLSSLTAWQGLFQHGILNPQGLFGDEEAREKNAKLSVLLTGSTGVVGSWATQLARLAGAGRIVALTSGDGADEAMKLGATVVIDYKQQSISEWVGRDTATREVDAVLDCVGGNTLASCWSAVKEGGTLLSVTGDPQSVKPDSVTKKLAEAKWYLVEGRGDQLEHIAKLLGEGKVSTKIDSAVGWVDFQAAFDKVEEKKAKGKVVIQVRED
ncbi:alcohol dehydrogenase [Sarocladium strictum]